MSVSTSYHHVQTGWIHWILWLVAIASAPFAFFPQDEPWLHLVIPVWALAFAILGLSFKSLTVRSDVDDLVIAFGPLRIATKRIPFSDIQSVEVTRSAAIDGWGIHCIPGRGWIWNIAGFDCVRLELANGSSFRIGTDDPQGLADFLRQRVGLA